MPVANHAPHPLLHEYVQSLWYAEREFEPPHDSFEILPDSYIELIFSFGAACQLDDGVTRRALPRGYIVGLLRKPLRLHAVGLVIIIAARFFAWGFLPLLGGAVGQPPPPVRQLDATLQQLGGQLEQHVAGGNVDAALEHVHAFLITQALQARCTPREIQTATQILLAERGSVTIADVADRCYVSRRQIERAFNQAVGVSPKALARQMRFERARDRLWQEPQASLSALADECGYADQAHFSREFKQFSNRPPRQFAAEMATTRALLHASDVAFVQET